MMSKDDSKYRAADTVSMRRTDLVIEVLDGEAVLYDPVLGAVHRFDASTFQVWEACDGQRNIVDIACLVAQQRAIPYGDARAFAEQVLAELRTRGLLTSDRTDAPALGDRAPSGKRRGGLSRRELLSGGATKLALAAPVISTFFPTAAYASGVGSADCRPLNYSCEANEDCCDTENQKCVSGQCCVQVNKTGCIVDSDCCETPATTCNAGQCTP